MEAILKKQVRQLEGKENEGIDGIIKENVLGLDVFTLEKNYFNNYHYLIKVNKYLEMINRLKY